MKYFFFILIHFFICIPSLKSQVTIGSTKPPESFSSLELDNSSGGLRVNQLTTAERDKLNVTGNTLSNGLLIFNVTEHVFEYWDGSQWVSLNLLDASNGLNVANNAVKLGGNLTGTTTIDTKGQELSIKGASNNFFRITDDAMTTNILTVNGVAKTVGVNTANPTSKLHVEGTSNNTLRIVDTNQGAGKVLTSDANGNATWKVVALTTVIANWGTGASFNPGTIGNGITTESNWIRTGTTLSLPPGKWMVSLSLLLTTNNVSGAVDTSSVAWVKSSFIKKSATSKIPQQVDFVGGKFVSGNVYPKGYTMVNGGVVINNTSSGVVEYELVTGPSSVMGSWPENTTLMLVGGSNWGENVISAIPIN